MLTGSLDCESFGQDAVLDEAHGAVFGCLVEFLGHVPDFSILLGGTKPGTLHFETGFELGSCHSASGDAVV